MARIRRSVQPQSIAWSSAEQERDEAERDGRDPRVVDPALGRLDRRLVDDFAVVTDREARRSGR